MILLLLKSHVVWTDGVKTVYLDEVTWIAAGLVTTWLAGFLVSRFRRLRALRRPPRRHRYKLPKRIIRVKRDLSSRYLRPGFSGNIHAVGIGKLGSSNKHCIQVFISDAAEKFWQGPGTLPNSYRGVPIVPIEMPRAGFLATPAPTPGAEPAAAMDPFPNGIREHREIIVGGISGANANLSGQSGTIGYFCTRRSKLRRRKEIHLLSNSHVFADLRRTAVDDTDLIVQPSPGEPANNRPIATLVNFSAVKFAGGINDPNHVDAAIARLWEPQSHSPVIPLIGAIKGYVRKKDIEVGEPVRKFGRTTGYTEGRIISTMVDIWIQYDRTGQAAFFQNQVLVEPSARFAKFVAKGDSGSLVVDEKQHAIGLIFAGTAELPQSQVTPPKPVAVGKPVAPTDKPATADKPLKITGYGVTNPISEVLDRLKIDLLV
jgi:hypothetical protein